MNVAIVVAIVALVSTIVGAAIGAWTTYLLAVRRERAEKEKDDRDHAVEVKRAARSIDAELLWVRAAADRWVKEKTWASKAVPLFSLSNEARQKYLDTIAPDFSDEAWTFVTNALQAAETIRVINGMSWDRTAAIPDDIAETFVPLLTSIDKGRVGLAPYQLDFPLGRSVNRH
jgi:hypothetical protein